MQLIDFCRIIGATVKFQGEIVPSGMDKGIHFVNVQIDCGHGDRLHPPDDACFGRDESMPVPNIDKAGEQLVKKIAGQKCTIGQGVGSQVVHVPADLKWRTMV